MFRLLTALTVAGFALLVSPGAATASDEKWTVSEVAGVSTVVSPLAASQKVAKGEVLAPGATLTTGADGKIVFGDGKTVVTVNANSRLIMPADPSDLMTRFVQDLGSVFFKVEKRPAAHFEVQTPLIAAVVKGTQFTVTAGVTEHSVEVSEGLVEVVAITGGQKEFVAAGHAAHVRSDAPAKLKVAGDPIRLASADATITRAIGVNPIDYSIVTGGLVTVVPPTTISSTTAMNDGGSRATNEASDAATGGSVVAVGGGTGTAGGVVANVDVGLGDASGGGGVGAGADAGAGAGGSGGVGVGVDVGAGTGGDTGVTVGAGVDLGGSSSGVGVGIGVGGTPPGQGAGVGIGVGGTPPGHGGTPPGQGGTGVGIGVGGTPPGHGGTPPGHH